MPPAPLPTPFVPTPPEEPKRLARYLVYGLGALLLLGVVATLLLYPALLTALVREAPESVSTTTPATSSSTTILKYLGFYTGGSTPIVNGAPVMLQSKAQIEAMWDDVINTIGQKGDGVHTQLGFWVGPLEWDLTDVEQRQLIDDAFAVAEEKDVAVGFHIDDSMFWNRRSDLWSNKNNVEWSDWKGTVIPHRLVGWVLDGKPVLAPPMCYNAPAIVKEATRIGKDVIGAEIKKNVDHLHAIGKDNLFMGVIAGWETHMQDGVYGYCALTNLGYTASTPIAERHQALVGIVHDWITLWTKNLYTAGIAKDKIFTHIGTIDCSPPKLPAGYALPPDFIFCGSADSNVVEFTDYSNPGFSSGPDSLSTLYTILAAHGSPPWGGSEVDLTFNNGVPTADNNMEQYLAGVFNHGGVMVSIFGWAGKENGAPSPFARADEATSSIAAYKKFLTGGTLSEVGSKFLK